MTTYHYAVGLNASKPWGNRSPQESCCGGTGAENHVKYQEAAYFTSKDCLWVGLYIPSIAQWEEQGVVIKQECAWPAEHSTISIAEGKGRFAMKLRIPYWATEGVRVTLNGKLVAVSVSEKESYTAMNEVLPKKGELEGAFPCTYVTIAKRKWKRGDTVEIHLPYTKHINYGPDRMDTAIAAPAGDTIAYAPMWAGTLMYGPLAMGTTGIESWDDAEITIEQDLSNVIPNRPQTREGTHGNRYTLTIGERTFVPDYMLDKNHTHYLRIGSK